MKKLWLLLSMILLLSGCGTNTNDITADTLNMSVDTETNESTIESKKMCAEYKTQYPKYLKERYNLIEDPGYSPYAEIYELMDGINYNVLKDYIMFYSPKLDSCVASFRLRHFYPTNGGHMDERLYYVVDALNETELWTGGGWVYKDEELDKIREEWNKKIDEYKS